MTDMRETRAREIAFDDLADLADRAVAHLPDHTAGCKLTVCPFIDGDTSGVYLLANHPVLVAWGRDPVDPDRVLEVHRATPRKPRTPSTPEGAS